MIHKFSRRGVLFALLASLAAVGLAIPAIPAAAQPTSLTSCQAITAPGTYRLDADVITAPVAPSDCFPISANNVTLILNGHTITGRNLKGPSQWPGISARGSGDTILGPGTLSAFSIGVFLSGGSSVRGVTATGNVIAGIFLVGAGNDVRGNVVTNSFLFGILVGIRSTGNTIIGNYAHGNDTLHFRGVTDLFDNSATCDSNVWRGNDFGTANQSCIH